MRLWVRTSENILLLGFSRTVDIALDPLQCKELGHPLLPTSTQCDSRDERCRKAKRTLPRDIPCITESHTCRQHEASTRYWNVVQFTFLGKRQHVVQRVFLPIRAD
jgi:hypothetical protein